MVNNVSYHSSDHKEVTILAIPGEEMTDILNKYIVGRSTNCDISKPIDKTNWYNLFVGFWPLTEF